jgi:hypothetical protein
MKARLGLLVLGLVVIAAALAAVREGRSEAATGPAVIRINDRELRVTQVDIGAKGISPGDLEVVTLQLHERGVTTRSIGHAELVCTFVGTGNSRVCRGTYELPRGRIVVGGSIEFRQFYDLAILGGTGLYDNARGTLTVTRTSRKPARHLVLFRLVG